MSDDCCNRTKPPFHIPGYQGSVPGLKYDDGGKTFAKATHAQLMKNVVSVGAKGPHVGIYPDPCRGHEDELRRKFHMLQGNIDPNPCVGISHNKFCVRKPEYECPPKLHKMNQHGYLSRLSVYQDPKSNLNVDHCKACNIKPCKGREPQNKPFWKEFEDITDYDPFQEYEKECRHLRLPKLKYKTKSCWDEEFYLPVECLGDYCREGYVRPPTLCECLPFDAKKDDKDINYYRHEPDISSFGLPYFMDPTNPHRYFKSGYTGHVPTERFRNGDVYPTSTRKALNRFTVNYITPLLSERCPVYLDPNCYADRTNYFNCFCDRRKSYDGHFEREDIRARLKNRFDPICCVQNQNYEPYAICIQPQNPPQSPTNYCNTKGST